MDVDDIPTMEVNNMKPQPPTLSTSEANAKLIHQGLAQYKEDKIAKRPHKIIQIMPLEEENLKNLEAYLKTLAPYGMVVGAIVVSPLVFSFATYCLIFWIDHRFLYHFFFSRLLQYINHGFRLDSSAESSCLSHCLFTKISSYL